MSVRCLQVKATRNQNYCLSLYEYEFKNYNTCSYKHIVEFYYVCILYMFQPFMVDVAASSTVCVCVCVCVCETVCVCVCVRLCVCVSVTSFKNIKLVAAVELSKVLQVFKTQVAF